jgi:ornithine cyclodeaminase/alanine dehydrogenase-like protein (mu-crystallin family)
MLVLSHADLIRLLSPAALVGPVEAAALAQDRGDAHAPRRQHIEWNGNTLLTMPAVAADVIGTKLVCVVPGNAARQLPVTNGVMILADGVTGLPLAALNAAALTALRTGAVGALGVKYLTPADTRTLGIIGCGVQGAWQAISATAVRPVGEIFCVPRSSASYERFAATILSVTPQLRITRCVHARELLERTSLVIAATTAVDPVLPDEPVLLEGKHFISIGSFRVTMQELPDSVYRLAGHIVIDSEAAREEVGDVAAPIGKGIVADENVFTIGRVISGERPIDVNRTTAFKSVGMALYDLHVARALYDEARRRHLGCEVAL